MASWTGPVAVDGCAELTLPDGRRIVCPRPHSAAVLWTEIDDGWYAAACRGLGAGGAIIDVGANVGLASVFFADRYPDRPILAIEPATACYRCLVVNLARHAPNATPLEVAVGAEEGTRPFVYYPNSPEQSTLHPNGEDQRRTGQIVLANSGMPRRSRESMIEAMFVPEPTTVPVRTLSSILDEQGISAVSLLKIDVEGGELEVLTGIGSGDWPRIDRLVVEVHDRNGRLARVSSVLERAGYRVTVQQAPLFAGSNVHALLAERD